ncbi:MAG: hypothetical protein QM831_30285 [Kofleriaceae bacterium]
MHPIQTIDSKDLEHVTGGGGFDFGSIMQMASPLLSMIPGVGGIMGMITPMLSGLGKGGQQQQQQPQQQQAPQQQAPVQQQAAPQAAQ